jgi:pimeloyl-ACP methyl ester carboxylesterase
MPQFERGPVSIHYEVYGSGFSVLLIAPGSMESAIGLWEGATIDPLTLYTDSFQLIGMDQRNAGRSSGPLDPSDPWRMYAEDQLALLDHLGIEQFHVMGACIGGSFALKLIEQAPARVTAAVLEQPVGLTEENRPLYEQMWRSWGARLAGRPDLGPEEIEEFGIRMWRGDFVVSASREFIRTCDTPLLVLPGTDRYHPTAAGREIATLAPNGRAIEPWNDSAEHVLHAAEAVRAFLHRHSPDGAESDA